MPLEHSAFKLTHLFSLPGRAAVPSSRSSRGCLRLYRGGWGQPPSREKSNKTQNALVLLERLLTVFIAVTLVLAVSGCGREDGETEVLRVSHPLEPTHPIHLTMVHFAEQLDKHSNESMSVEIYPGSQLGNARESIELLQIGSMDLTVASAAVLEGFVPEFKVFGLPYLFTDSKTRLEILNGALGTEILESALPVRLRGMAYFDAGSRSFYTKEAVVNTPADLVGQKVRVMNSPMAIAAMRALGASPTPISWGELYTALQQGVVDAAENNPPSLLTSRHYEITPYFSLDEHTSIPDVFIISETSWQRLSSEQQGWVLAAAREAALFQQALWATAEVEALEKLKEAGITIHYPDKQPFVEAVASLYQTFAEDEPELFPLVERIRNYKQ